MSYTYITYQLRWAAFQGFSGPWRMQFWGNLSPEFRRKDDWLVMSAMSMGMSGSWVKLQAVCLPLCYRPNLGPSEPIHFDQPEKTASLTSGTLISSGMGTILQKVPSTVTGQVSPGCGTVLSFILGMWVLFLFFPQGLFFPMLTNTNIKVFPDPKLAIPAPFHQPTSADLLAGSLAGMAQPRVSFCFSRQWG